MLLGPALPAAYYGPLRARIGGPGERRVVLGEDSAAIRLSVNDLTELPRSLSSALHQGAHGACMDAPLEGPEGSFLGPAGAGECADVAAELVASGACSAQGVDADRWFEFWPSWARHMLDPTTGTCRNDSCDRVRRDARTRGRGLVPELAARALEQVYGCCACGGGMDVWHTPGAASLVVRAGIDTCIFAGDGSCDEVGQDSTSGACLPGTDFSDCKAWYEQQPNSELTSHDESGDPVVAGVISLPAEDTISPAPPSDARAGCPAIVAKVKAAQTCESPLAEHACTGGCCEQTGDESPCMSSRLTTFRDAAWRTAAETAKCAKPMAPLDLLSADVDGNCIVDDQDRVKYAQAHALVADGKAESCPDEGSECDAMLRQALKFYAADSSDCLAKLRKDGGKLTQEDAQRCFAAEFCTADAETDAVRIGLSSDMCQPCLHDCEDRARLNVMSTSMCCPRLCKRLQRAELPCTDVNLDLNGDCKADEHDLDMMASLAPQGSYSRMCDEQAGAPVAGDAVAAKRRHPELCFQHPGRSAMEGDWARRFADALAAKRLGCEGEQGVCGGGVIAADAAATCWQTGLCPCESVEAGVQSCRESGFHLAQPQASECQMQRATDGLEYCVCRADTDSAPVISLGACFSEPTECAQAGRSTLVLGGVTGAPAPAAKVWRETEKGAVGRDVDAAAEVDAAGAFHLQQLARGFAAWAPGTDEQQHRWGLPHPACRALDRSEDADRFLEPACCPAKAVLAADGAASCQEWQQMKGSKAAVCLAPTGDDWCYSETCCHVEFGASCRTMLLELKGDGKADVETACEAHAFGHGDDIDSALKQVPPVAPAYLTARLKDDAAFGPALLGSDLLPRLGLAAFPPRMTCAKFVYFSRAAAVGGEPCCAALNGAAVRTSCAASCRGWDTERCSRPPPLGTAAALEPKNQAATTAVRSLPLQSLPDFASAVGEAVCPQQARKGMMAAADWEQCKLSSDQVGSGCPEVGPLVLAYYACLKSGDPCACHGFDEAELAQLPGFQSHPFTTSACKLTPADRSWLAGYATLAPAQVEGDFYSCVEKLGQALWCLLEEHRVIFWLDGASPHLRARSEAFTEEVTELARSCGTGVQREKRRLDEPPPVPSPSPSPVLPPPSPPPPPPVSMVTMWLVLIAEAVRDPFSYFSIFKEYWKDFVQYLSAGGDAWKSPNPPPPAPPPPSLKRRLDRLGEAAGRWELFSGSPAASCSWVKRENATFDGALQRAVAEMRDDVLAWRDGGNVYKAGDLPAAQQMCSKLPGCFGFSGSVDSYFLPAVDTHYLAMRGSAAYRKVSRTSQWSGAMNNYWLIWPRTKLQERAVAEFWSLSDDVDVQPCTVASAEACGLAHAKSLCESDDECGGLTKRVGGAYRGVKYAWEKPQVGYTSWVKIPSCGVQSSELPWWHPSRHAAQLQ